MNYYFIYDEDEQVSKTCRLQIDLWNRKEFGKTDGMRACLSFLMKCGQKVFQINKGLPANILSTYFRISKFELLVVVLSLYRVTIKDRLISFASSNDPLNYQSFPWTNNLCGPMSVTTCFMRMLFNSFKLMPLIHAHHDMTKHAGFQTNRISMYEIILKLILVFQLKAFTDIEVWKECIFYADSFVSRDDGSNKFGLFTSAKRVFLSLFASDYCLDISTLHVNFKFTNPNIFESEYNGSQRYCLVPFLTVDYNPVVKGGERNATVQYLVRHCLCPIPGLDGRDLQFFVPPNWRRLTSPP